MESNSIIYILYKNGIDWQMVKEIIMAVKYYYQRPLLSFKITVVLTGLSSKCLEKDLINLINTIPQ